MTRAKMWILTSCKHGDYARSCVDCESRCGLSLFAAWHGAEERVAFLSVGFASPPVAEFSCHGEHEAT